MVRAMTLRMLGSARCSCRRWARRLPPARRQRRARRRQRAWRRGRKASRGPPRPVPSTPPAYALRAAALTTRPASRSACTSRSMTRPSGPVGRTKERSAPVRSASALARGEIFRSPEMTTGSASSSAGAAASGAAACAGASSLGASAAAPPAGANSAVLSPGAPMTQTFVRQGTSSPSWKKTSRSVPSTLASSSRRPCRSHRRTECRRPFTASPFCLAHLVMIQLSTVFPCRGMITATAIRILPTHIARISPSSFYSTVSILTAIFGRINQSARSFPNLNIA